MKASNEAGAEQSAVGRAHAKLILLGEHAVVYGHPALVVGAGEGATARAALARESHLTWASSDALPVSAQPTEQGAFRTLAARLSPRPFAVEAQLAVPAGVGLGASAALGVAIAQAVAKVVGCSEARQVLAAAHAWECCFHATPSGVDAAAALHGGALRFCGGQGATSVTVGRPLELVACRVEAAPPTHRMVAHVRGLREARPAFVDRAFVKIGGLVARACGQLTRGEPAELGALMNDNHAYLKELGLSTENLERVRSVALANGALGAKLSGAGGGGCLVVLAPETRADAVIEALRGVGCWCRSVRLVTPPPRGS